MNDSAAQPEPAPAIEAGAPSAAHDMSPQELAEARRYGQLSLFCGLTDKGLDLLVLGLAAFVFAAPLDRWLAERITAATPRLIAILLIVTAAHACVSFPLSWYSGYVLEHRFGLSKLTFGRWLVRYAKRTGLAVGFALVMVVGLYWMMWLCGTWWWIVACGVFFAVSIVLGQLMPVVILPLFYKIEPLDNAELAERMAKLAAGTGLSIQGVYRMGLSEETAKANAMLAGLGGTRRVLMGDTLLDQFSLDEIEVIFAHEIGHHVFHHIRKMIVAGVVYSLAGFWLCDRVMSAWVAENYGPLGPTQWPPGSLPLLLFVVTLFGLVLEPLQNVISRHYERQCDRYALVRTGMRAAYVSAFQKLARLNKDDPAPHPLEVFLFHSHPPIGERLAMAGDPAIVGDTPATTPTRA